MALKTNWGLDETVLPNDMNQIGIEVNKNTEKLKNVEDGANKYVHPKTHDSSMIVTTANKRFTSDNEMDGKSNTDHDHNRSDITDFEHTHNMDDIEGLELSSTNVNRPNGKTVEKSISDNETSILKIQNEINGQTEKAISMHNRLDKVF